MENLTWIEAETRFAFASLMPVTSEGASPLLQQIQGMGSADTNRGPDRNQGSKQENGQQPD